VSASLEDEDDSEDTEAVVPIGIDGRLRVPQLLTLAGITSERVSAERVGDEIFLGLVITGMPPASAQVRAQSPHPLARALVTGVDLRRHRADHGSRGSLSRSHFRDHLRSLTERLLALAEADLEQVGQA
jgi:hypothetical protein